MTCLTRSPAFRHDAPVAQTTRCGRNIPEPKGGHRRKSGFFTSAAWITLFCGQAMREPFGVAGFLFAGLLPRMVPPSLRNNRGGGYTALKRNLAMQANTARGASAPAKFYPLPFLIAIRRAGTVRRCLVLASKSAEALQAVLNRQPEGVAFAASCHVAGGVQ